MILRTPNGPPLHVFFLTNAMARLLAQVSIPLKDLKTIETYHQKATFGEIAQILKLQHQAARELGVPVEDPQLRFANDYEGGMLKEAFNSVDGESLSEIIKTAASFGYVSGGLNTLVVLLNKEDETCPANWSVVKAPTFSGALLESIFHVQGYLGSHFGKIVKPSLGEFTMAEVYKLLGLQNP